MSGKMIIIVCLMALTSYFLYKGNKQGKFSPSIKTLMLGLFVTIVAITVILTFIM